MLVFWPVEELTKLADEPTGRGEVAKGGCSFAWNFGATRSPALPRGRREGLGQTLRYRSISDSLQAYSLEIPPAKNHVLRCKFLTKTDHKIKLKQTPHRSKDLTKVHYIRLRSN